MSDPLISAERVEAILADCLYKDEELVGDDEEVDQTIAESVIRENAVVVEGVVNNYGFHPERLEAHRAEVMQMLQDLPREFGAVAVGGGGGWSFLNACDDRNGVQWTGLHQTMEHLFCLGIGLGMAAWLLPREMWASFPGGMPYVVVNV